MGDEKVCDPEDENSEDAIVVWHRLCVASMGAAAASCSAWLLLAGASVELHGNEVGMSSSQKAVNMHNSMLTKLTENANPCKGFWDKPDVLSAKTRASGSMSYSGRDLNKLIHRRLNVDSSSAEFDCQLPNPNESDEPANATLNLSGSCKLKRKRKDTVQSDIYDTSERLLQGLEKMSTAIVDSAKAILNIDKDRNVQIFEVLQSLELRTPYLMRCYIYLCENPTAGAVFLGVPPEFRKDMLICQVGSDGDST